MGVACNCSRNPDSVKDTVPSTFPGVLLARPQPTTDSISLEDQRRAIREFRESNRKSMHRKIGDLAAVVMEGLDNGVKDIKLHLVKMKDRDWEQFGFVLQFCGKLTRLDLWKLTISNSSLNLLCTHILQLDRLESLTLSDMNLASYALFPLTETLKSLGKLKELGLSVNYFSSEHFAMLMPSLLMLRDLETISLDENELGDLGAEHCALLIEKLPRLRDVSLKYNSIGQKGFASLLPVIAKRRGLVLRLEGNEMGEK